MALGQNQQQNFWNWFFYGGAKPRKPVKAIAFNQQQSGATPNSNAAWGGMEYEAKADEDLDAFAAQGYDAAQALGSVADVDCWALSDDSGASAASSTVPASSPKPPAPESKLPKVIAASMLVGAVGALVYGALAMPSEVGRGTRYNDPKRKRSPRR